MIFREQTGGEYVFERIMFWNIPNADLDEVRRVWEQTVHTIREGVTLVPTSRGVSNNLPKQTENRVAHVRPHGKDASDKLPLPDGRMMTRQCFWLNNTYIAEQINRARNFFPAGYSDRRVTPVAQGRIAQKSSKMERYDALSPGGQMIADAAEVLVNAASEKIKEKALETIEKIVTKKKH